MNDDDDDDMIVIIKLSLKQDTLPYLLYLATGQSSSTQLKEEQEEKEGREGKRKCRTCGHLRETPFVFRFSPSFLGSE